MRKEKIRFVLINSLRGLMWLSIFAILYLVFKKYVQIDFFSWLQPVYENEILILLIFLSSEVIVGIIPPELFIIWALRNDQLIEFMVLVSSLSVISYLAGLTGYMIGHYLNMSLFFRFIKKRFLRKLDRRLNTFGIYLIMIAALTPLPFSGVSMLIGSVRFPFRRFALFALTRFLRFVIYALVFWKIESNI